MAGGNSEALASASASAPGYELDSPIDQGVENMYGPPVLIKILQLLDVCLTLRRKTTIMFDGGLGATVMMVMTRTTKLARMTTWIPVSAWFADSYKRDPSTLTRLYQVSTRPSFCPPSHLRMGIFRTITHNAAFSSAFWQRIVRRAVGSTSEAQKEL